MKRYRSIGCLYLLLLACLIVLPIGSHAQTSTADGNQGARSDQGSTNSNAGNRPQGQSNAGNGRPAEGGSNQGGAAQGNQGQGRPEQAGQGNGRPAQSGQGNGRPAQAGQGSGRPGGGRGGRGRGPALVVAEPVTEALINDRLKAVGSGKAVASVSVVPLSSGILTEVTVKPGQQVAVGDVIAKLDDAEEIIARDRAARTAADAAIDEDRLARLFRSNTTTEVELNNAKADLADAELALREAELTLERRTVTAPIAGIVGFVSVDPGNYVTPQTELVTVDDRSTILVEFWVPERFANQVRLDQPVEATALAIPGKKYQGTINAIGSRIETDSRTLPVQAMIDNASDSLRPGMSFELALQFPGETYPAVDPLSVKWDSTGSYVWQIVEDKAKRVPVQIIQRNPESVLVNAELQAGDQIATEGLLSLRPGASVRIQGAGRP